MLPCCCCVNYCCSQTHSICFPCFTNAYQGAFIFLVTAIDRYMLYTLLPLLFYGNSKPPKGNFLHLNYSNSPPVKSTLNTNRHRLKLRRISILDVLDVLDVYKQTGAQIKFDLPQFVNRKYVYTTAYLYLCVQ